MRHRPKGDNRAERPMEIWRREQLRSGTEWRRIPTTDGLSPKYYAGMQARGPCGMDAYCVPCWKNSTVREATRICDAKFVHPANLVSGGKERYCNEPICEECARWSTESRDLCPDHAIMADSDIWVMSEEDAIKGIKP